MINFQLLALKLFQDEKSRKALLILCALFIIVLLITGGIYVLCHKYIEKEKKVLDTYMYDLLQYRVVRSTKEFKQATRFYEKRIFFKDSCWAWNVAIILTVILILLAKIVFKVSIGDAFKEALNLIPNITWPKVGEVNNLLEQSGSTDVYLSGFDWMPATIIPSFNAKETLDFSSALLYVSTVYYVVMFVCFIGLVKACLGFVARKIRCKETSKKVFQKDLDKISNLNLDNIQLNQENN